MSASGAKKAERVAAAEEGLVMNEDGDWVFSLETPQDDGEGGGGDDESAEALVPWPEPVEAP